ncbi:uncharacterized protein [Nicotiana sylvestris]|uniref:uncharacterized protein n=1 Tax=Nicotiana sylvestris TaxID=4096 RepID=UPI00388CE8CE
MVEKGCDVYQACVRDVSTDTPTVKLVPVVGDYPDVFLVDLPGMPPNKDIDFGINLPSDPPYSMAPPGLREHLQELLDKGFIRPTPMTKMTQRGALFWWIEGVWAELSKSQDNIDYGPSIGIAYSLGSYTVYYDASQISLGAVLMQDGRVIAYASIQLKSLQHMFKQKDINLHQRRWLKLLKDYDITILYHHGKANVVVDALSHRAESLGSLAYLPVVERPLALDVQALANHFLRFDISEPSRVSACVISQSSLYDRIRERQYDDHHLLVLKDKVQHSDAKEVTIGYDGALRMQGTLCVPNVDGLRELIL